MRFRVERVIRVVPAEFVRALDGFEAVLAGTPVDRWLSPSPCEGWCAVDVAGPVTAGLLVTAERMAPRGRDVGMVGPEVPVLEGADDQARLLAVFGRSPVV